MKPIDQRNVNTIRRQGKVYYYYRPTGKRLPDDRKERDAKVAALNIERSKKPEQEQAGTFGELITRYKSSPKWAALAVKTRESYSAHLDTIRKAWGENAVKSLTAAHVEQMQTKLSATPRKADYVVSVLRALLSYGVKQGFRPDNPARKPGTLAQPVARKAWTDADFARFCASAPAEIVLAAQVALYTGQRLGDLTAMLWSDYDGAHINVVQSKTGAELSIPAIGALRALLDPIRRDDGPILRTMTGRPWTAQHLKHKAGAAIKAAGLTGLVFHGLRHTAAVKLAEAGCSAAEIQAITGHKGLAMVQHYTKKANQKKLGSSAMARLEASMAEGVLQNDPDASAKPKRPNPRK